MAFSYELTRWEVERWPVVRCLTRYLCLWIIWSIGVVTQSKATPTQTTSIVCQNNAMQRSRSELPPSGAIESRFFPGTKLGTNSLTLSTSEKSAMKKSHLLSAAAALSLCLSGNLNADPVDQTGNVSPAAGTSNNTMSAVKDEAGYAVGVVSAEMTTTLQGFVAAAATSDMYEVEAGKIAEARAQDPQIKAFAEKMVKAHTESTDKLKSLLVAMKSNIAPPAQLDDRRESMIDELRGAKDADFDARYLTQQVDAHKEALILMHGYAKDGDVPSIKKFAAKMAPAVQSHLDMAEHLAKAGA